MEKFLIDDYFFITKEFNEDYIYRKESETELSNYFDIFIPIEKDMKELCWLKCRMDVSLLNDLTNLDESIGKFSVKSEFMPSSQKFNDLLIFGSAEFEKKYGVSGLWNNMAKIVHKLDINKFKIENFDVIEQMESKVKFWLSEKIKSSEFNKNEIAQLKLLRNRFKVTVFNNMLIKTDKTYLLLEQCKSRRKYGELKQKIEKVERPETIRVKI